MAVTITNDAATTRTNLGLGDAATKTVGTASGNIPVLDSSGQIADAQIAALSVSKLSGVGTSGQVLTSTGTTTAPTMQDAAGGGKVLQVKQVLTQNRNTTTATDTGSTGGGSVGLNLNITPVSSTSKFLINVSIGLATLTGGNSWGIMIFKDNAKVDEANGAADSNRRGVFFRGPDKAGNTGSDGSHGVGGSNTYLSTFSGTAGTSISWDARAVVEGGTFYLNRTENADNVSNVYGSYSVASLTVTEVEV
jgi:hypothetical protein